MQAIVNLFGVLEQYSIQIIIILIEIIFALFLVNSFFVLKNRKHARELIDEGETAYLNLMESGFSGASIIVRREDKKVVYVTDNIVEFITAPKEQIINDFDLSRKKIGWKKFWDEYNSWDKSGSIKYEYKSTKGKETIWSRVSVSIDKSNIYESYIFEDITKEVNNKLETEERLSMVEEESRSKTSFLSSMSHEIRTPMNGIMGMTNLALGQLPENHPAVNYLNKSAEVSQYLLTLINDILDMSRIESGKVELENKVIDIYEVGTNLANMFQKSVESKGVKFAVNYEELTVRYIVGDELRLSQVLINFLSNAVKFTAQGEIIVTFRQMFLDDGKINLMMRVHDTGKGMDPGFVSRIFHPFEQENAGISKKYGGTGLGMAITDQIIKLMDGEIIIDTFPGKGSDFSVFVNLPIADENQTLEKKNADIPDEEIDYSYEGKKILLAEDNMINKEIAVKILERAGATVDAVENGREAVDKFKESPLEYYDFILMDIQMPLLNGREASMEIRKLGREDANKILIFALSADAFIEDIRLSMENGMNGHFSKPIDFEELRIGIGKVVKEKESSEY